MAGLKDILEVHEACEGAVLGTVVDVRGSAYRRPGARMLLTPDGRRVGMISGGCLDKDVARCAWAWTASGPRTALYDTRGDALNPQGAYGSGCDGVVKLFLERLPNPDFDLLGAVSKAWSDGAALGVATIYDTSSTLEGLLGARVALQSDAPLFTDPRLPQALAEMLALQVREARSWRRPRSVEVQTHDGLITALIECIAPPVELLILGAGDDARPLCQMAAAMGWRVRVADKWPALATRERFPNAAEVLCADAADLVDKLQPGPHTHAVLMTHSFGDDTLLLPRLLATDAPWIGLMGPRRRTMNLMRALLSGGQRPTPEALARIQTPVGLDLGADAPEEVALSILGGLTAFKNDHRGGLLRERSEGAIHDEHERLSLHLDTPS